jgi:hypothetical protein
MTSHKLDARDGWSWLTRGAAMLRQDAMPWAGMGLIFMLIALALKYIPFLGILLLVLLCPLLLAGALQTANELHGGKRRVTVHSKRAGLGQRLAAELRRAAGGLFVAFSDEEKLLPLMVISALTLAMVVVINILAELMKIDAPALTAMTTAGVGPRIWGPALVGWLLVVSLEFALTMALLFTVPLIVFRKEQPLIAIGLSLSACRENLGAVAVFGTPFIVTNIIASVLFYVLSFPLDYLALLILGWWATPLFATGLYRAYQDVFVN